jgi:DNA invertase Pin-like site-specific DNA recombinase
MTARAKSEQKHPTSVALYARVSTANGHQNPAMQLRELRLHAHKQGWKIIGEYVDHGVSGTKESRPELNRLMEDAKAGKVGIIATWKLDRLGRSLRHLVNLLDSLRTIGVTFFSLRDNIDLQTSTGQLQYHLLAAFAQFERDLIGERVKAGLAHAKSRGVRLGKPKRSGVDIAAIARLRAMGITWRDIESRLNIPQTTCRDHYRSATVNKKRPARSARAHDVRTA